MDDRRGRGRERVLDPVERMSEILFGLIMVLSFTGSISVADAGREDVRAVLIGAIGCNLAWGLIDAVMYLLTLVIERGRNRSIGMAVRESRDPAQARKLIAEALPEPLDRVIGEEGLELARSRIAALPAPAAARGLEHKDWMRAVGVFLLVFLSTFPVVLPFLFVTPLQLAMRVSNGVAIAMLYSVGHTLGRHAGIGGLRTGLAMVAIGALLVSLTIALGG